MTLLYVGDDPEHFRRPLFRPSRCRSAAAYRDLGPAKIEINSEFDRVGFDAAASALARFSAQQRKPPHRMAWWLWRATWTALGVLAFGALWALAKMVDRLLWALR